MKKQYIDETHSRVENGQLWMFRCNLCGSDHISKVGLKIHITKKHRKPMEKQTKRFTVQLWAGHGELRVIDLDGSTPDCWSSHQYRYLPEHEENPPRFATAKESWDFIKTNYPHLQP